MPKAIQLRKGLNLESHLETSQSVLRKDVSNSTLLLKADQHCN